MKGGWRVGSLVLAAALGAWPVLAGCTAADVAVESPPIPTINAPTSLSVALTMTDRPLGDDCADVADPEDVDEAVGQQLPGSATHIIGIPEPSIGRTAKLDCYFGIPDGQGLAAAAVTIGLATYTDAQTAQERYRASLDSERSNGATPTEVRVGKEPAVVLPSGDNQLLIGTLGKTSYLVSVKRGLVPDDRMTGVLTTLAQHALTPKV